MSKNEQNSLLDVGSCLSDLGAMLAADKVKHAYFSKRRYDLLNIASSDSSLSSYQLSLLTDFFMKVALDSDLQGLPQNLYLRYKRAMLCFLSENKSDSGANHD